MLDLIYQFTLRPACHWAVGLREYTVYLAEVSHGGMDIPRVQASAEGAYYSKAYWIVLIVFGTEIS